MSRLLLTLCLVVTFISTSAAKSRTTKTPLQRAQTRCTETGDASDLLRVLRLPAKPWRDAYCDVMDVNVTGDQQRELAFHVKKPIGPDGVRHLLVVFDSKGRQLASLEEVSSDYEVIAVGGETPYEKLERVEKGKEFPPLQYRNGRLVPVVETAESPEPSAGEFPKPKPATCPNVSSTTYSDAAAKKVSDLDLFPPACGQLKCVAECPDETENDVSTPFVRFFGSFSAPKVMEALVGIASCDRPLGNPSYSELVLLRQTACGWQRVAARESFNSTAEQCRRVSFNGKDVLVCKTFWGPFSGGYVESLVATRMSGSQLESQAPLILERPFRHCHGRVANWARFGDWRVESTRVELTINEWSTRLSKAVDEADPATDWSECEAALQADRPPSKRHRVTLFLDAEGLHLTPESAQALSKVAFTDLLKIQER